MHVSWLWVEQAAQKRSQAHRKSAGCCRNPGKVRVAAPPEALRLIASRAAAPGLQLFYDSKVPPDVSVAALAYSPATAIR